MRFATWNIGSLYTDFEENVCELKRQIKNLDADVLCMQEFPDNPKLIDDLIKHGAFKDYFFYVTSASHVGLRHDMGVIMFAKDALTNRKHYMLIPPNITLYYHGKEESIHNKAILSAKLTLGQISFTLTTGHGFPLHRYGLGSRYDLLENSFLPLEKHLRNIIYCSNTDRVIVGGDFNCENMMRYSETLRDHFYDVFYQISTRPDGYKTDAIFLQKGVSVKEKAIRCVQGFDHFLLYVDVV